MSLVDLHIHTTYSDGKNTPEEIVIAAIKKGITTLGFSDHSYTDFDNSYCMSKEKTEEYIAEISFLKGKYKDKIQILLGIEQDIYSPLPTHTYDYVIGSVHYLKIGNDYIVIDETSEILENAAKKYFGGDFYALTEEYFRTVARVLKETNADIIGHLDLIAKFNEGMKFFDEGNPRYISSYKQAVDKLLEYNKPFEINTGAISRGYRTTPYPAGPIVEYIKSRGGKFILSSDSHSADTLCFDFDKYKKTAL